MKRNYSRIFFYLWPHAKAHWLSFTLIFVSYGVGIIFDSIFKPFIYKQVIDTLVSGNLKEVILQQAMTLGITLCLAVVLQNVGYRAGDYMLTIFESKIMKELHDSTFKRLLGHSYHFFTNNFSGSIVAKSKRFAKSFETFMDILSFQIWFSLVIITGIVIILLTQAPILAYIFLGWSLFYILVTFLFIKQKIKYDTQEAEADSLVTASLADSILNIINIKIFSSEKKEQERFGLVTKDEEIKRRKAWIFANMQNTVQALLMGILQVTILFLCIHLWYIDELSLGVIVLVQAYMLNLFEILWSLGRSVTKAMKALTDMKEVIDIFDTKIDISDPKEPQKLRTKEGSIFFDDISFTYMGGASVFDDFTLMIKPGERIGLVGHSGAGKSTITKLLLRFADVTKGSIFIDGQDISTLKQNDLRAIISYVPQESILFHRTIKENISYGKQLATDEEVKEVAKKAHAHEFIIKLPNGYETMVGERGIKLSGGERQRVAIARAMLKNAPILVLDEATSSLDSVSESYIQSAFVELMKGKTTLVIAHRLSTIQKMDRIIVLENGRIAEMGNHQELIERRGVYANLWHHQSGGFIK